MSSSGYEAIEQIISRRSSPSRGMVADRSNDLGVAELGLRRSARLLEALDNPHLAYEVIHVAGSKGKGTTSYLSAELLRARGWKVGLYTSPHLSRWNERVNIDGEAISDNRFLSVLLTVDEVIADLERREPELGRFNAFELLTAAGFTAFRDSECDAAVVEVGLGGRFDTTNHVKPQVSVITTIEAEHLDVLGPDLAAVAWNKAGIIKAGVPVVVQRQVPEVLDVIEAEARESATSILLQGLNWDASSGSVTTITSDRLSFGISDFPLPGAHNAANLGAAVVAVSLVIEPEILSPDLVNRVAKNASLPGRFSICTNPATGQIFVVDGAHTLQSVGALTESVQSRFGSARTTYLLSILDDKPWEQIIDLLSKVADQLIFPPIDHIRAVPAESLLDRARQRGLSDVSILTITQTLELVREDRLPIVVTGSFGIVREVVSRIQPLTPPGT